MARTEALKRAQAKYQKKNREKNKLAAIKSNAKKFIKVADNKELENMKKDIESQIELNKKIESLAKKIADNPENARYFEEMNSAEISEKATEMAKATLVEPKEVKAHVTNGVIPGQGNESFWILLSGVAAVAYDENRDGLFEAVLDNDLESGIMTGANVTVKFDGLKIPELVKVNR
ncbi:hypothetical protein phig1ep13 [Lactobacillus phage phig1e]|uniref:hypothetical protein n=1 Tax=Lactobacillus phage phig1e TaxID=52979 RepID=UPI000009B2D7|nr:hypothetical protein phig1ep13 [Lactobacillus phage phig1e]pir/T13223/ protein R175 - Lactobacillus phage phi-gle [Lactobacillus phage phi-gle]CAA62094.1 gp175 [Lactobacillus phage phig1e]CAA66752.1 Rorf175 [Lactobacillus phage phig1e]